MNFFDRFRPSASLNRPVCFLLTSVLFLTLQVSDGMAARVALYVTGGVNSETVLAFCRAISATGHTVYGISNEDIQNGRLTTANFDLFILPPGQDGSQTYYFDSSSGLGAAGIAPSIQNFVAGGGGFIGIEAGAHFASSTGVLKLYNGPYSPWNNQAGGYEFDIVDPEFGSGTQELFISATGGYFPSPAPPDATTILENSLKSRSGVRTLYGAGRVILMGPNPVLRGDSDLDWTRWDNWVMQNVHSHSIGAWELFGRMINWVHTGNADPAAITSSNPLGERVAVVSSYEYATSAHVYGGAWPGLLPAVARAIEDSGHVPLAIRFDDVAAGRLLLKDFSAVVFPGGNAAGYWEGLNGSEELIRSFVSNGGCYLGICAGSYYASSTYNWQGATYDPPLNLFSGQETGPIADLSADPGGTDWTYWSITPITINDPVLGNLGTQNQFYLGGGYKTDVAGATAAATYAASGSSANGRTDAVRFSYGNGRVLLSGAHPEVRAGSNADWLFWDNYSKDSATPLNNPDNPWLFFNAVFNKWFFPSYSRQVVLSPIYLLL